MTSHVADGLSGTGMVGSGSKYAQVAATTTLVKNGQGRCAKIIVTVGTGAVTLQDGTAGTTLWTKAAVAAGDIYALDVPCTVGISVIVAAATTVIVVYI